MPVTRTQEKTQQVVNTHVHHVVNTVKVEKPEIIEQTVEVPQVQYINKVTDVPVVVQRQMTAIHKVKKTVDVPQVQHIDRMMDLPLVKRHQEPTIQRVQKTVDVPQIQFIDKFVDAPVGVQADPEIELAATTPVAEDRTWVNLNITDATPPVADPSMPQGFRYHPISAREGSHENARRRPMRDLHRRRHEVGDGMRERRTEGNA